MPVTRSLFEKKEALVNPDVPTFLKIEMLFPIALDVAISGLPSPSRSLTCTNQGLGNVPVVISILVPKVKLPGVLVLGNTFTLLPVLYIAATTSSLPFPSRSLNATPRGLRRASDRSTFAANEEVDIVPLIEVLRKSDIVLPNELATAISGLPSPSMSPIATVTGFDPVAKSIGPRNEEVVILPGAVTLRKTDTVYLVLLVITRSGLPSLSMSLIATKREPAKPTLHSTLAAREDVVIDPGDAVLR